MFKELNIACVLSKKSGLNSQAHFTRTIASKSGINRSMLFSSGW